MVAISLVSGHGHLQMGSWNGLMGALVNKQTDMVLSALKVDWPIIYVALGENLLERSIVTISF